jgi:hypothetical protein
LSTGDSTQKNRHRGTEYGKVKSNVEFAVRHRRINLGEDLKAKCLVVESINNQFDFKLKEKETENEKLPEN